MANRKEPGFVLADLVLTLGIGAVLLASVWPDRSSARIAANEKAAIADLSWIATVQAKLASSGAIDTDDDGVGEYGFFGELMGTALLRSYDPDSDTPGIGGLRLTPPLLPPDFGTILMDSRGEIAVLRNGYLFKMFLPDVPHTLNAHVHVEGIAEDGPIGIGGAAGTLFPFPDTGEALWCCYAWPLEDQVTGHRVFFVNQQGRVLQNRNDGSTPSGWRVYGGLSDFFGVPDFDAAYSDAPESPNGLTGMGASLGNPPRRANDGNVWTYPIDRPARSTAPGGGGDAPPVVLDFDELQGQLPPFLEGTPVQPDVLIDTQYFDLGVVFDAPGGGIFVAETPNSASLPNAAGSTSPGPLISYSDTITANFWVGDAPATVGFFSVRTSGPSSSTVSLYDVRGRRFATGTGAGTFIFQGTGLRTVHIDLGPMAFFDDFTFTDLQAVQGLVLSPLLPGRAGATNELRVTGGTPGETVLVEIGLDARSPGARLPSTARTLRVAPIDADGRATVSFDIPADCAGMRLTARALSASGNSTQAVQDYVAPQMR